MGKNDYTTKVGDYLIVTLLGCKLGYFVAEVVQSNPLEVKIEEKGDLSRLGIRFFEVCVGYTNIFRENRDEVTKMLALNHRPLKTGLSSLGSKTGELPKIILSNYSY